MKITSTRSFAMNEKSKRALMYLKKRKVNVSHVVQQALIYEARKEQENEKNYPDDFQGKGKAAKFEAMQPCL